MKEKGGQLLKTHIHTSGRKKGADWEQEPTNGHLIRIVMKHLCTMHSVTYFHLCYLI